MESVCNDLSVTISVYKNDNPIFFKQAMDSIISQTVKAKHIIITVDGPINKELELVVHEYEKESNVEVIWLEINQGLGLAHSKAIEVCPTRYLAIMDSDDISVNNRFEKQMVFLYEHPEVDILGGNIEEFISETGEFAGKRIVPSSDCYIKEYMKKRCPFNHMTVILKVDKVKDVGNYLDWHYNEDYYLWLRMYLGKSVFANLEDILVNVRVGTDMYKRRGGFEYFKSERGIQKFMRNNNIISWSEYIRNIFVRFVLQVLMPNTLRSFVFQRFARNK